MEDSCLTMLCWFLPYMNMNQPQVHICLLPPEPSSHLPHHPTPVDFHRVPGWVPCDIQQIPTSYLFYIYMCVCMSMHLQSCPTLCDPVDCSPPGSSVHGILQARILEWVAISFSRGSYRPRDWTRGLLCLLH